MSLETKVKLLSRLKTIALAAVLLFISIVGFEYLAAGISPNPTYLLFALLSGFLFYITNDRLRRLNDEIKVRDRLNLL